MASNTHPTNGSTHALLADRLSRRGVSLLAAAVLLVTPFEAAMKDSIAVHSMLGARAVVLAALLVALGTKRVGPIVGGRILLTIGICDMVAAAAVSDSTPDGIVVESIAYGTILPVFALLIAPGGSRRRWSAVVTSIVAVTAAIRLIPGDPALLVQVIAVFVVHSAAMFSLDAHADRAEAAGAMATIDPLTGLVNRRPAIEELTAALVARSETGTESSVIMIDLDRFKELNDTLGHEAGDDALRRVADALAADVGPDDVVSRWGGEEFLVVLRAADSDHATLAAERMRLAVERLGLTASFGVAPSREPDTVARWVARADSAMYAAKHDGRNRVVVDTGIQPELRSDPT